MAMSPEDMADAIFSEMEKEYWPSTPLPEQAEAETKRYYAVLSKAIIDYVKKNCDVNPGTFNVPLREQLKVKVRLLDCLIAWELMNSTL